MINTQLILSVSQLNRQIRNWLEHDVGAVLVEGEVSTVSLPSSGHYYFTLKDHSAQIRCVFFKNRHQRNTDTILQAGQQIIASGQLSLYEARGDYQLIVNSIESSGLGALYRQFELLKTKLAALGLFNPERKRTLPRFPKAIGIITSSSGAALQDILTTLARRYPIASITIYPSDVQGATAASQLIEALEKANQEAHCDVLILARGGGSIEDLWAFNDENLAHAISNSRIPVVSGIGHETDFTIADFVADYRAATPTAAAETVTPNQLELLATLKQLEHRLLQSIQRLISHHQLQLRHRLQQITSPSTLVRSHWQSLDHLKHQLETLVAKPIATKKYQVQVLLTRLSSMHPLARLQHLQLQLQQHQDRLHQLIHQRVQQHAYELQVQLSKLHLVSPLATLDRGYAIATLNEHVLHNSNETKSGDKIHVRLRHGSLFCEVLNHA